jgi:hypothetical protein
MSDLKGDKAKPIVWQSPNGATQTAVRIPCAGTRDSFRKSAKQTGWIEHVIESMLNEKKVLPEVGVEWLIEAIFERHRPQFDSFCERKGYQLPTMARMPKDKTAAMWTDAKVLYAGQRIINQHCYEHFRRWIFAKEEDVRGFGDKANNPHLKEVKEKVRAERKRKFKRTSEGADQMARKKVTSDCRASNLEGEIEMAKDNTIVTGHEAAKGS